MWVSVDSSLIVIFFFLQVGKLREKIAEQMSEHARLVEENEKLKKDNQAMVSIL